MRKTPSDLFVRDPEKRRKSLRHFIVRIKPLHVLYRFISLICFSLSLLYGVKICSCLPFTRPNGIAAADLEQVTSDSSNAVYIDKTQRNMKNPIRKFASAGSAMILAGALASSAHASLSSSYQFNGTGNWSIDAVGGNSSVVGLISAIVPLGSTIEKAFLYSSLSQGNVMGSVDFDGTILSGAAWTNLGANGGLRAYRADVTSLVAAKIGGGSASAFSFQIGAENPNLGIDGEALAIVYSNPSEAERTIAFLDGFSASGGDSTSINLTNPITGANLVDPNFEAIMSLGIGFGFQPTSQFSQVDVNGNRLTTSAGGQDDGQDANGGLITIGGIGDSTDNPADPFEDGLSGPRYDDELYSLTPFLSAGDTSININTRNPSGDDNIFFAGFNITARAGVNAPPPPPTPPVSHGVPDSGTTGALLGFGILALAGLRSRFYAGR